jgi:hypothetical protein
MLTVSLVCLLLALATTFLASLNPPKGQLWVAVLLLIVIELLRLLPQGR